MSTRTTDNFNHTIHLDCGCRIRLNLLTEPCDIQCGNFLSCVTLGHSERHYDQVDGELIYEADREVIAVIFEPYDGVIGA